MSIETEHQRWYYAFTGVLKYLKSKNLDLTDILKAFEEHLSKEGKRGLSMANLKRYKSHISNTRIDGLSKFVKQIEAVFGVELETRDGVPVLNFKNEIVIKTSKLDRASGVKGDQIQFNCYYRRSDNQTELAILTIDSSNLSATFSIFNDGKVGKRFQAHVLNGWYTLEPSRLGDSSELFFSIFLKAYDPGRGAEITSCILFHLQKVDLKDAVMLTGTFTTNSRTFGNSVAGLILAWNTEDAKRNAQQNPDGEIPGWIGNYLNGRRVVAEDIYNQGLKDALISKSFFGKQAHFKGKYVGYYLRSSKAVPTLQIITVEIFSNGTARMESAELPSYQLHFEKYEKGTLIGFLEQEIPESEIFHYNDKNRNSRWKSTPRVTFAFSVIDKYAETPNDILLYGVYGGIEHSNTLPISGRIVLRKLHSDEEDIVEAKTVLLDASNFFTKRNEVFSEKNPDLVRDIQAYLNGKILPETTDYEGASLLEPNLPQSFIGKFICFSMFSEEDNDDKLKLGKYPLEISYPNNVVLWGRNFIYTGKAHFVNNLLVFDLISKGGNDLIRMLFRARTNVFDHAYGTSIGRRGVNPESRAEVLLRVRESFVTEGHESKLFEYDEAEFYDKERLAKIISQDSRFVNIVNYLKGQYNRYITVPFSVPTNEFDYEVRVKSERRSPFYAAKYLLSTYDGEEDFDQILEIQFYLKSAHFHGFAQSYNFGNKGRFDERAQRLLRQYENEIQTEMEQLKTLILDLKTKEQKDMLEYVADLWGEIEI